MVKALCEGNVMNIRMNSLSGLLTALFAAVLFVVASVGTVQAQRLALVVGNAQYDGASDLKNSATDAAAMAKALKSLDFTVTLLTDVDGPSFWADLDTFIAAAETAESAVFFYSGHAFQMSGVNYLVPVGAKLESRELSIRESLSLDTIIAKLQSRSRQTLIFLDACRNDPLPKTVRGDGAASDGLARVQTGVGTFVAFATSPGGVAADAVGDAPNSPFTTALLKNISTEGISISDMMIEVRNDVEVATLRQQAPWDQSSLREQFYFVAPKAASKQELSEKDFELLAQLSPEDRKTFMDLLGQSGFDPAALEKAETQISLAEADLQTVAFDTITISAPVVAVVPETLKPADAEVGLADLTLAPETVKVGIAPSTPTEQPEGAAPIRLAALNFDTRGIDTGDVGGLRLEGRVLQSDNESDRAVLAAIDPSLIEDPVLGDPGEALDPAVLKKAVQSELRRLGCYQMGVDGDWGKGSRTALTSYYLAKKIVPTTLEPTEALYAALKADSNVVCKVRYASTPQAKVRRDEQKAAQKVVTKPKNAVTKGKYGTRPAETAQKKVGNSLRAMGGTN